MTHSIPSKEFTGAGGYVPELDTFRLAAILSVMCLHWLPADNWFNRLQDQTSNGVHLFFVLSGYLITGILLRCRLNMEQGTSTLGHSFRQFYTRRFLRIFPAYYFVLAIGVVFHFEGLRRGLVWHATYMSNFYYFFRQKFDGPASLFWTLAVEEQFYLLWPLAILTLPKRFIFPFVAAIALLGTACRVDALLRDTWLRILTPYCMNFLAIGSLLAVTESSFCGSNAARRRLLRVFALLIAILFLSVAAITLEIGIHRAVTSSVIRTINQPMMSMLYASIFAWSARGVRGAIGTILRQPALVYLGRISYGLYVYHLFVSFGLIRGTPWLANHLGSSIGTALANDFACRFATTVAVASLSWFLFEKPLNELKRYFPYSKRPSNAGGTGAAQLCQDCLTQNRLDEAFTRIHTVAGVLA